MRALPPCLLYACAASCCLTVLYRAMWCRPHTCDNEDYPRNHAWEGRSHVGWGIPLSLHRLTSTWAVRCSVTSQHIQQKNGFKASDDVISTHVWGQTVSWRRAVHHEHVEQDTQRPVSVNTFLITIGIQNVSLLHAILCTMVSGNQNRERNVHMNMHS
jgi:hypothetical protein